MVYSAHTYTISTRFAIYTSFNREFFWSFSVFYYYISVVYVIAADISLVVDSWMVAMAWAQQHPNTKHIPNIQASFRNANAFDV